MPVLASWITGFAHQRRGRLTFYIFSKWVKQIQELDLLYMTTSSKEVSTVANSERELFTPTRLLLPT